MLFEGPSRILDHQVCTQTQQNRKSKTRQRHEYTYHGVFGSLGSSMKQGWSLVWPSHIAPQTNLCTGYQQRPSVTYVSASVRPCATPTESVWRVRHHTLQCPQYSRQRVDHSGQTARIEPRADQVVYAFGDKVDIVRRRRWSYRMQPCVLIPLPADTYVRGGSGLTTRQEGKQSSFEWSYTRGSSITPKRAEGAESYSADVAHWPGSNEASNWTVSTLMGLYSESECNCRHDIRPDWSRRERKCIGKAVESSVIGAKSGAVVRRL
jgi:hypothetical protein